MLHLTRRRFLSGAATAAAAAALPIPFPTPASSGGLHLTEQGIRLVGEGGIELQFIAAERLHAGAVVTIDMATGLVRNAFHVPEHLLGVRS